ncbi:hypothetical protein CF126_09675 [Aeromonas dhakensis]|nr:hypothetical protein CF126_09675 [Aeromonas dhakensis]
MTAGIVLGLSMGAHPSSQASPYPEQVVIPIPSVQVDLTDCENWWITQTYTATAVPGSVLSQLEPMWAFSYDNHLHAQHYKGKKGRWVTDRDMYGTAEEKLAMINKAVFGTKKPKPGRTKRFKNEHGGSCAADEGLRECVGVFVMPLIGERYGKEPTTFPLGMCAGMPPALVSCEFDDGFRSVDLGSGGRGTRGGSTTVSVRCTRPVVYRVSELPGNADPDSLQIVSLTVQGGTLPYVSPGTQANENLTIEVEAKVSSEGLLSTQRVLRIDIP